MRETDRAFDAFDLMAVCHGWHGIQGINADVERVLNADQSRRLPNRCEDLANLIRAVIEAETSVKAMMREEIRLPASWSGNSSGLETLWSTRWIR